MHALGIWDPCVSSLDCDLTCPLVLDEAADCIGVSYFYFFISWRPVFDGTETNTTVPKDFVLLKCQRDYYTRESGT